MGLHNDQNNFAILAFLRHAFCHEQFFDIIVEQEALQDFEKDMELKHAGKKELMDSRVMGKWWKRDLLQQLNKV